LENVRPAQFCDALLATLTAADGRRRRRVRNTTPDAIGLALKRELLEAVIAADPDPDDFEEWLLQRCIAAGPGSGGLQAMALSILEEWRLAESGGEFQAWLRHGAQSDDAIAE
jgi:hypothetical protein